MKKIEQFQITSLMLSGFKSYEEPTELVFGNPTVITGGNGRGKSSIADAIAFAVTGCPFFGERGIDRLHNENNPDVAIRMCLVDETGTLHELNRTRRKNRMTITYDGYEIRQLDLADLFGERDVFLSILNPLYFIEELGEDGKKLLERYLPTIPHETVLSQLSEPVREHLKNEMRKLPGMNAPILPNCGNSFRPCGKRSPAEKGSSTSPNSRKRWRKRLPESKTWVCGISGKALHIRRFMPVWSVLPVTGA